MPIPKNQDAAAMAQEFKNHLRDQGIKLSCARRLFSSCPENGKKSTKTFGDVYQQYCKLHLPTISLSSRTVKQRRLERFVVPLLDVRIQDVTTEVINELVLFSKRKHYELTPNRAKWNFTKQLKDLSSLFSWWLENLDPKFYNPVRRSHYKLGILKEIPFKQREISQKEFQKFLSCLKQPYLDFAYLQLFVAGRVGEIAGIHLKNIDIPNRRLLIKEVMTWVKGKPHIKHCPKNGKSRGTYLNDKMIEIIERRKKMVPLGSPLLFNNRHGQPMSYNQIQEAYNRAWKKAGLSHKFSGTHQVRYCAAQMSRRTCGSLDAAMALTGHASARMAEKYSAFENLDLNKKASENIQQLFVGA